MRRPRWALPVVLALSAVSPVGATAQDEARPDGLVTEEVQAGVERIIRDDAGHDLDATHPSNRYDLDGVAVKPDGTVWLTTTYNRSDNDVRPGCACPGRLPDRGRLCALGGGSSSGSVHR